MEVSGSHQAELLQLFADGKGESEEATDLIEKLRGVTEGLSAQGTFSFREIKFKELGISRFFIAVSLPYADLRAREISKAHYQMMEAWGQSSLWPHVEEESFVRMRVDLGIRQHLNLRVLSEAVSVAKAENDPVEEAFAMAQIPYTEEVELGAAYAKYGALFSKKYKTPEDLGKVRVLGAKLRQQALEGEQVQGDLTLGTIKRKGASALHYAKWNMKYWVLDHATYKGMVALSIDGQVPFQIPGRKEVRVCKSADVKTIENLADLDEQLRTLFRKELPATKKDILSATALGLLIFSLVTAAIWNRARIQRALKTWKV